MLRVQILVGIAYWFVMSLNVNDCLTASMSNTLTLASLIDGRDVVIYLSCRVIVNDTLGNFDAWNVDV